MSKAVWWFIINIAGRFLLEFSRPLKSTLSPRTSRDRNAVTFTNKRLEEEFLKRMMLTGNTMILARA
jgi:hypothetical protein